MHVINSESADEVWRKAAVLVLDPDHGSPQSSRGGDTVEVLHVALQIDDPSQRWVVSRVPAINPAFALVEALWIAAGRRDAALPTYWNPALPKFCGNGKDYHGAYGYRLRQHLGVDQLDRIYHALDSAPDSRQCVLQIWDSTIDLPNLDGTAASQDIPCNIFALPKIRRGQLEWLQVIRSNDLFRGVPHNIVQFTCLQEILSGWLGIKPGPYVQLSDSLHVYANDIRAVRSSLVPIIDSSNTDTFALDRCAWEDAMRGVMARLDALMRENLSRADFKAVAFCHDAPPAYDNSVIIAAADAARRRGWSDLQDDCVDQCTNRTLVGLWSRWRVRCETARGAASVSLPAADVTA